MSRSNDRALDLVTLGRAAVDLYGEQTGGRLEDMASFAKYLGGCPANIAVGPLASGSRSASSHASATTTWGAL